MIESSPPVERLASKLDSRHHETPGSDTQAAGLPTHANTRLPISTLTHTMPDPRDFLALCRLGVPGLGLLVLGLAGVIIQKNALRRTLSFAVLMIGAVLLVDAAGRFHQLGPSPVRSLTFLTIALAPLLLTVVRSLAAKVRANSQTADRIRNTDR